MKIYRCQVKLSRVVQIDIPEDVLGNQLVDVLAMVTARSEYGFENRAEVLLIEESYRPDKSDNQKDTGEGLGDLGNKPD